MSAIFYVPVNDHSDSFGVFFEKKKEEECKAETGSKILLLSIYKFKANKQTKHNVVCLF